MDPALHPNQVTYDRRTDTFTMRNVNIKGTDLKAELDKATEIAQRLRSEWDNCNYTEHPFTQYLWLAYCLVLYHMIRIGTAKGTVLLPYAEAVSGPLLSLVRLDRGWAVDMGECLPHVAEALRKKEGLSSTLPPGYSS